MAPDAMAPSRKERQLPEVLPAEDAALWWVQSPDAPLWIGAVAIFDAGPLRTGTGAIDIEALERHVTSALGGFPRFRQRLVDLSFGQGLAWVDEDGFEVADHVHLVGLPEPGGEAELRELVGDLLERPLPASRPLWDIWVVDGLDGDRVALIPQVNHVLADGTALIEFALSLLSFEPQPERPARSAEPVEAPPPRHPSPVPGPIHRFAVGTVERTRSQVAALARLAAAAADPRNVAAVATALTRAGRSGIELAADLPITRPVGPHRDLAWTTLSWAGLDEVKRGAGVTLNDVLLAVTTGAFVHYLDRGEVRLRDRAARLLVPVAAPHPADAATSNTFGFFLADMPLDVADPLERLRTIHDETTRQKRSTQRSLTPLIFSIADLVPPAVLRAMAPTILRNQPFVNAVVTNMPGSPQPLYLLGAPMTEVHPFICGIGNLAVVIGALSYADGLGIGITVDRDVVDDVDVLIEGMHLAADELLVAYRAATAATDDAAP